MNLKLNQISYVLVKYESLYHKLMENGWTTMMFSYSTYNEGYSVIAEEFVRTLKSKTCNK